MRRFLHLFHVPEDGEVTEKHLKQVLVASLCSIFLCMSCLIGSTWALFQTTIVSEGNTITVGAFEVTLSLVKGETSSRTEIDATDPYTYELSEVGTYNIFIVNTGSIPGYCTIDLTDANGETATLTSGTLYPVDNTEATMDSATIAITISAEDVYNKVVPVTLEITSSWGEDPNYEVAEIDEELFVVTEPEEEILDEDSDSQETLTDDENIEQVQNTEETEDPDQMKSAEATESTDQTQDTEAEAETQEEDVPKEQEETTAPTETEGILQENTEYGTQSQTSTEPVMQDPAN